MRDDVSAARALTSLPVDPRWSERTLIVRRDLAPERPAPRALGLASGAALLPASGKPRVGAPRGPLHTPLLPPRLVEATPTHATLTLLGGADTGKLVAIPPKGLVLGRDPACELVIDDPAVSRRHARIGTAPDGSYYVEDLGSTNGTFVGPQRTSLSPLAPGALVRLGPELTLRFSLTDDGEQSAQSKLYESATRDPLTHVFNRRYFDERLKNALRRSEETGESMTLLVLDVDHLKQINDRFGHLAGDRALGVVAARVSALIRPEDVLARLGGDEFVVLLAGKGQGAAARIAQRIRSTVAALRFSAGGVDVPVTVSIGLASADELGARDSSPGGLFSLADRRLYRAKSAGRNRISAAV